MDDNSISDPEKYRRLSEPFESPKEFDDACTTFYDGLRKLREECGLPDVYVIIGASVIYDDVGVASQMLTVQTAGSSLQREAMTAWAFGREQEVRQQMIQRLMAGDSTKKAKRKKELFD